MPSFQKSGQGLKWGALWAVAIVSGIVLVTALLSAKRRAAENQARQSGFTVIFYIGADENIYPFLTDHVLHPSNRSTCSIPDFLSGPVALSGPEPPDSACKHITDADLEVLANLPNIRVVSLRQCNISDSAMPLIGSQTKLTHLNLSGTKITDAGLRYITSLGRLKELNLAFTDITDEGLTSVSSMTSLERLSLCGTQVTDTGLRRLHRLTELKVLNLDSCSITSKGIGQLNCLPSLTWLHLMYVDVCDEDAKQLAQLKSLTYVGARRTGITERGAKELRHLIPGVEIWVDPPRNQGAGPSPVELPEAGRGLFSDLEF